MQVFNQKPFFDRNLVEFIILQDRFTNFIDLWVKPEVSLVLHRGFISIQKQVTLLSRDRPQQIVAGSDELFFIKAFLQFFHFDQ